VMPYAMRLCQCGTRYTPRARNDEACGPCRLASPSGPTDLIPPPKGARILTFDIESAGVNALKSDLGFVVCFGYKFSDEKAVHCLTARKRDLKHFDDRWILAEASRVFERADLVVGHFASVFDRRFLQGRLAINRLPPIPPTKLRDTCMIARSAFNFSSNRLGRLSEVLDLPVKKYQKKDGEWPRWWFEVMQGNTKALADMATYCKADVLATEALYRRLLGFDRAHPRIVEDRERCGACGGAVRYHGFTWANGNRYRRYACTACGRWDRGRVKV
jgi:RNase H-like protein